ncbi:MAG: Qat anti-phage system associated protein QatB [Gammaproteobacteria bacterium]
MGTSNAFGGASGGTPLIPSWLDGDGSDSGASSTPADGQPDSDNDDVASPAVPPAPQERPAIPAAGASDRFTAARGNFTRFAGSGGRDRRSLGRAVSQYVSKSAGGSRQAARRMGASRGAATGLVGFLNNASTNGVREALRSLNLESLAGRPIEEVFVGLADYVCPDGGSIDEGIARDAFVETIADLAEAGITDIDGLTSDQIQTVFELYATHAIEARICNDIGTKLITMPSDPRTAEQVEGQLRDFIQRGVSDALNSADVNIRSLASEAVMGFVTDVYQSAFEILQTMGEGEAAK